MEPAQSRQAPLHWAQRPLLELTRLSWPIALSTLSYSLMTLVDTLLVGRLGAAQLAGVGLGGTAAFALLCFSFGLLRGVKTLVSQAVGADRKEEVGSYLGAAMGSALLIGLVTALIGQGVAELLVRISASAAAGHSARLYLQIRVLGAPMALLYVAVREVRYGQGDARSPMIATIVANVVNVVLAYLLVFTLHRGVAGAAWATVCAHGVEAGVLLLWQRHHGFDLRRTAMRHLRALWRIGLPTGLQFTLEVGSFALLAALIAALSEVEMAAHQIALQVIQFSFLPAFAVAEAASVLVGQAVGADRDDLVLGISRQALWATGAYTGVCTLCLVFLSPWIVAAFHPQDGLAQVAVRLLHVAAVFQIFDSANMVARAALRGTGDVRFPAVVGVVTAWLCTPPLTWLLGYRLRLGAMGGWLGLCCEIIVGAVILWGRMERRTWLGAAAASRRQMQLARDKAPEGMLLEPAA